MYAACTTHNAPARDNSHNVIISHISPNKRTNHSVVSDKNHAGYTKNFSMTPKSTTLPCNVRATKKLVTLPPENGLRKSHRNFHCAESFHPNSRMHAMPLGSFPNRLWCSSGGVVPFRRTQDAFAQWIMRHVTCKLSEESWGAESTLICCNNRIKQYTYTQYIIIPVYCNSLSCIISFYFVHILSV